MTTALEHWPAPPARGWKASDLDHLPTEGPNGERLRYELIDGVLVFMSPQRRFHERTIAAFRTLINAQAPEEWTAVLEMDVILDKDDRPIPDVLVIDKIAAQDEERTHYTPDEVLLIVEVVSPDSKARDRRLKPLRYAEAGIPHFWRVENVEGKRVVHVYELVPGTRAYKPTGIFHGKLSVSVPFPIEIDLDDLPL